MSIDMTFFPESRTNFRDVVDQLATEIEDHSRRKEANEILVFHTFSNGGTMLMVSLLKRLGEAVVVDGAIYDSCPSKWISPIAAPVVIAAASSSQHEAAIKIAEHMPHALVSTAISPFVKSEPPFGDFPLVHDASINKPRPELFIFSDADKIINSEAVENFAARRAAQGSDVRKLRFLDSSHCGHLRKHPIQYVAAVEELVSRSKSRKDFCGKSRVRSGRKASEEDPFFKPRL